MSAVLVFGTCVPGGGVQALADDGADQPAASQDAAAKKQDSDEGTSSQDDAAPAGEKNQDASGAKSVSRKDSGTSPSAQGDKPSATPAAAEVKKMAAANASAAPASLVAVYVDGTNGNDANDGSSFDGKAVKTLAKALQIQAANKSVATIFVKGSLSLSATASIPSGVTFSVASEGATISGSGNSVDGIVLKSGSTLTGAGKLTMTGFKTALTSEKGSTITDGTYVLKDNAGASGTHGIYLAGTVKGTSRDRLTITADDKSNTNFYASGVTFENCTVNVTSQARTWFDAFDLNLKNASLTVKGFGQTFYVNKLNMDGSDLTINPSFYGGTGMTIQGSSNIMNSHVTTNAGSTAGISVGAKDGTVSVTNSTLEFNNGGTGGLNVNTGMVVLSNSTIKGNGDNSGALFGAQSNGSIVFGDNCLVETPAKGNADNGAGQTGKNFVVTGGSYLVKYAPSYNSSYGSTIPTNGSANGDEKLSLFTLTDASMQQLNPVNANGAAYSYSVVKSSSDGEKHVWVPAAKVTFKLNADDAEQKVDASFADGSTADQTSLAMRGYALRDAKSVAGGSVELPTDPFAAGYKFVGWFYKDANGEEQQFSDAVKVSSDVSVYAKWESDSSSYAVKYHNGASPDVTYLSTSSDPSRSLKVLSADAVTKANPSFARSGKIFKGWNTKADGTGGEVAAGSSLTVPADKQVVDLYAVWEDQTVTVRFSANGGTFSKDSVFKKNPDVFDIYTDKSGGEVATVKSSPKVSDKETLDGLLKSLSDGKVSASTEGVASSTDTDTNAAYTGIATYKYHVLANKKVTTGWWIFTETHYYYWFEDPSGTSNATFKGGDVLSHDVTYYLKWDDDPAVERESGSFNLPSDIWSGSQADTTSIKEVKTGEKFGLTGAIDASVVTDQMGTLEKSIAGGLDDLSKISLSDTASTFSATITLPDGVVVPEKPEVTVTGLGNCFEVKHVSAGDHQVTVTFGLKRNFSNYQELRDAVNSTGGSDAVSPALFRVSAARAAQNDGGSSRQIKKPITVMVGGLTLDAKKVANGDELTATGMVSGDFSSYAENTVSDKTKRYDYHWDGSQIASGQDPRGNDIRQTILVVKPAEQDIPADILVGKDTEHDGAYPVLPGQTIDFTGAIDASVVKGQMRGIESLFPNTKEKDYAGIALSDMTSSFTATFTVPDGMTLPDGISKDSVRLDGFADIFYVDGVSVNGKTVTITMRLRDGIQNYAQLRDAVNKLGDMMRVTLPGVRVADDFPEGKTATVSGTVAGTFDAHATKTETGTTKVFSFKWYGRQKADGMDATANSVDDGILFTVVAASPVASKLPSDMLVGDNTEHDSVIELPQGSTFDLTGAILASSIKDQMEKIEAAYPKTNHDGILLDNLRFSFVATFTAPDGVSLPADLDASKVTTHGFGDGFKASDVKVSGKTVSVTFALSDPDAIKTYSDLEKIVDAAGDGDGWMKLTVPGVLLDKDAEIGAHHTIVGTVDGSFGATAESEAGTHKVFSFTWKGVQLVDGKDVVATDDEVIQLTVKPVKSAEPNPSNPTSTKPSTAKPTGSKGSGSVRKPAGKPVVGKTVGRGAKGVPKTGDATLPAGAVGVMVLGGAAALAIGARLRRRRQE